MNQDTIALVDQINGYTYIIQMQNGSLVSSCAVSSIKVTVLPDKLIYTEGEYFESTGMVVMGVCADGSTREISNIIIPDSYLTVDTTSVEISYIEAGITYTASVPVTVTSFDLVDFDYTANANGTYILTGWKGTLNGITSTEMIIPNNGLIVV